MRTIAICVTISVLAILAGCAPQPQETTPAQVTAPETQTKPAAPPALTKEEIEAKWQAASTPGPEHQRLNVFVGEWDAAVKMWMDPSAPPAESKGTCENHWILGGRYLEGRFHGTFEGMPMEGISWTGYDNVVKKYVGNWIDNMGTGIMIGESSSVTDAEIEWRFEYNDPMTGAVGTARSVHRLVDDDHHHFEMWMPGPDGKEFKSMEIDYTRKT